MNSKPKPWPRRQLGEVLDLFDAKRVPLNSRERASRKGPYPYYGASGIVDHVDDFIFEGRHILIAEDGENLRSRKTPIAFFADGRFWVNNHAHIARAKQGIGNDYFVRTVLEHTDISGFITGAAQPKLTQANLRLIEIPFPSLADQGAFAAILGSYDDLIESNAKRIGVLEKMARSLYREWFVNFRFPGHEKVKMVGSSLGKLPEGWTVAPLGTVTTKIGSGATPRGGKESYGTEGISLIRSLNVYDYTFEFAELAHIDEEQAAALENVTVKEGDVLLNITGASVARCAMVPAHVLPARVNQHVAILRADPSRYSSYLLLDTINADENKQRLLTLAQAGATREALTKEMLSKFSVLVPPRGLLRRYAQTAGDLHTLRDLLRRQVQVLQTTRDLLLPRLLSGEVAVGVEG